MHPGSILTNSAAGRVYRLLSTSPGEWFTTRQIGRAQLGAGERLERDCFTKRGKRLFRYRIVRVRKVAA